MAWTEANWPISCLHLRSAAFEERAELDCTPTACPRSAYSKIRCGLYDPRTTTTGVVLWVSTFTVSLPSTTAETPRRPCDAITIASHPLALAVSMIATHGCSCSTCTTSQGTPAFVAASFATLRYFAVSVATRVLYSFGVSVTILGSTAKVWNGADTVTAVTLAPRAFASLVVKTRAVSRKVNFYIATWSLL
jgi:hypothetical protein